jgi:hypothetical protein
MLQASFSAQETLDEGRSDIFELVLELLAESTFLVDLVQELGLVALQVAQVIAFPFQDTVNRNVVQITVDASKDEGHHLINGHGRVLLLLEELGQL